MQEMDELYTIKEFCKMFKISRDTFYLWERKGKVKATRVAGHLPRIPKEEVERLKRGE
jgi:excisionase family DNA binding protein